MFHDQIIRIRGKPILNREIQFRPVLVPLSFVSWNESEFTTVQCLVICNIMSGSSRKKLSVCECQDTSCCSVYKKKLWVIASMSDFAQLNLIRGEKKSDPKSVPLYITQPWCHYQYSANSTYFLRDKIAWAPYWGWRAPRRSRWPWWSRWARSESSI